MSVASHQLADISKKLVDHFAPHAVISITSTKGDPPDRYEITYTMTGLVKDDKDTVTEAADLTIEISIPFGFPHFPPSCKPKSNIFHPDFDPAAICLGEFWHQDTSLADLVIHIGRMINGEIYSRKNTFNEEACLWYLDNKERFPLTPIVWGNENGSESSAPNAARMEILEEDLLPDFNFFALEKDEPEDKNVRVGSMPESSDYDTHATDRLLLLEGQKKFYQLLEVARTSTLPPEELQSLIQNGELQVAKAEELHARARILEERGEEQEALQSYAEVGATVSDFPAIHTDIQRITRALTAKKGTAKGSAADRHAAQAGSLGKTNALHGDKKQQDSHTGTRGGRFLDDRPKRSKAVPYLLLLLFSSVTALGLYFWNSFHTNLNEAEQDYAGCITALDNDHFSEAKRLCEQALQAIKKVKFIEQEKAWSIQGGAEELVKSEKLTQGLAGNILIDGKYLPESEAKILKSLKKQLLDANALYLGEKWQKAAESYAKIEIQAKKSGLLEQSGVKEIQHKRLISEFRVAFDRALVAMAMVAEQKGQWEVAVAELIKAQNVLTKIPEADREVYSEQLQYALQKCRFEDLKSQGDLYYSKGEWQNAITSYRFAMVNAEKDSIIPDESLAPVRKNISRVEVYLTIDEGNRAFESGKWDAAILAYNRAISQLTSHGGIFDQAEAETNSMKLQRIVLKASIVRDRQSAESQLKELQLQDVRASYQQILSNIGESDFSQEDEFAAITQEISTSLKNIEEKIYIAEKEAYLAKNYQRLFTDNYPTTIPENLVNPIIKFIRETPAELVFKMQCSETGRTRPLTLVMFYAFNKKTGRWSFFAEDG